MVGPTISLSTLHRADGSAKYTCPTTGYSITASVNAPIELPARKEALKPEEATIEVSVKPGHSTAAIGERYAEGIVRSVLENVVQVRNKAFARRGVVINLLIEKGATAERADSYLTILPALLHTSLLALLSAAVPLTMTFATALLGVTRSGQIVRDPSPEKAKTLSSVHVLCYSSTGHLLLNESQGQFSLETWDLIQEEAASIAQHHAPTDGADGDVAMGEGADAGTTDKLIREAVEDRLYQDYKWKLESM